MRLLSLLRGDIYFQYKYGFYLLYAFFTLIYITTLYFLPDSWKDIASAFIIFSDPALIGLMFMGAIVLFEKSERVLNTIAVSPITVSQYVISKLASIAIISLASGLTIGLVASHINCVVTFILGLVLGSILFSMFGLIISVRTSTLNGFFVGIAPIILLVTLPPVIYMLGVKEWFMQIHPGVAVLNLILNSRELQAISILVLSLWSIVVYYFTIISVNKMMKKLGGDKS